MNPSLLTDIENRFDDLSRDEQLLLIERLVHRLRSDASAEQAVWENDLALMAQDPEIRREFRQIDQEFRCTEADGLERIG